MKQHQIIEPRKNRSRFYRLGRYLNTTIDFISASIILGIVFSLIVSVLATNHAIHSNSYLGEFISFLESHASIAIVIFLALIIISLSSLIIRFALNRGRVPTQPPSSPTQPTTPAIPPATPTPAAVSHAVSPALGYDRQLQLNLIKSWIQNDTKFKTELLSFLSINSISSDADNDLKALKEQIIILEKQVTELQKQKSGRWTVSTQVIYNVVTTICTVGLLTIGLIGLLITLNHH